MTPLVHTRLLVYLSVTFVFAFTIGVLSHEAGHFVVAKFFGYEPTIHYQFTDFHDEILASDTSVEGQALLNHRRIWMLAGGPLETMIVSSVTLLLLFLVRKPDRRQISPTFFEWVLITVSLFWMRQPVNFTVWLLKGALFNRYSFQGDEVKIASMLGLPIWFLLFITATVALIVLYGIVQCIPKSLLPTVIISAFIGGILEYLCWSLWLGPILLG